MAIINGLLALALGAFIGRFMGIATRLLPPILLGEAPEEREPSYILERFLKKPQCPHQSFLPLVGFFYRQEGCNECQEAPFGFELGIALLFGVSALVFPATLSLGFILAASCLLICCFVTDYAQGILPDQFTLGLVWLGLIGSLAPIFITPAEAITGSALGYGIFWLLNALYKWVRGREGMYPGDFKLNAGIGALVGPEGLLIVVICSMVLLLITAFAKRWSFNQEVPYGCYASIVAILFLYMIEK